MKKSKIFFLSGVAVLLLSGFQIFDLNRSHYASGPEPGHSGDPASGRKTCASCHRGAGVPEIASVISSDIPAAGYIPGIVYTFSVSVNRPDHNRYGFQISPQDTSGNYLGELLVTDSANTQINTTDERYINHTFNGIDFPEGKAQWSFRWKAPEKGSGNVTFYGAFLISNNNSSSRGDTVAVSTYTVTESLVTSLSVPDNENNHLSLKIYPNPVTDFINYSFQLDHSSDLHVSILNSEGKVFQRIDYHHIGKGKHVMQLHKNNLTEGLYKLQITAGEQISVENFWVK